VMKAAGRQQADAVLAAFGKREAPMGTEAKGAPAATAVEAVVKKAVDEALQPILDQFAEGWKALRDFAEKADPETPSTEAEPEDDVVDPAVAAEAEMALSADMLKSAPEAVVKAIEAQRVALNKAREDIAKERDIRLDMEAIAVAKATYPNLALTDDSVKAIRRASLQDPTLGESLKALLVSSNAMLDGGPLLKELGNSGNGETLAGTAAEQVEAKAKALVEAGEYDTIQKARVAVYHAQPELAEAHKEEVR